EVLKVVGELFEIGRYLGGEAFLYTVTIINNKLSLTTKDYLTNTGANGYIFVSVAFARKMVKYLHIE
ncbi:hypothetical protein QBC39DRAFT_255567, partial [Podospora conica]